MNCQLMNSEKWKHWDIILLCYFLNLKKCWGAGLKILLPDMQIYQQTAHLQTVALFYSSVKGDWYRT